MTAYIFGERFVEGFGLVLENSGSDGDTSRAQFGEALTTYDWVRILHASNNAANASGNDSVGAWAGTALMRARFQINKKRCVPSFLTRTFQRQDFRVLNLIVGVEAFSAYVAVVIYDDSPHARIR